MRRRVIIRAATESDASAISRLIVPAAREQIAHEFAAEGRAALLAGMTPEAISKNMLQGYAYLVAEDVDGIVGVLGMRGYSHIYHLFVGSDRQRQGIASLLWQKARRQSLAAIRISEFTVYSSRVAEAFYYKLGFRRSGDEKERQGVIAIPMRVALNTSNGEHDE
ncbi:MAG: GNAT family N-acetyltransferase [Gammaproteobacteria bacterium]|nr:GNAT family N-acetyltransferase [Gammaproteobacteria bacterium]